MRAWLAPLLALVPQFGSALRASSQDDEAPLWYPFEYEHGDPAASTLAKVVPSRALCKSATPLLGTMKSANKLEAVMYLVDDFHKSGLGGDFVEAGVAQGGGVLPALFYLACTGDLANRTLFLFDTWQGLPPAADKNDKGFKTGAFHVSMGAFMGNVKRYGRAYDETVASHAVLSTVATASWQEVWSHVQIVKGLFADTMPQTLSPRRLALLMCDGDMYASTKDCMSAGAHRVVPGGGIYNDDYYTFRGCYEAVHEYLQKAALAHTGMSLVPQKGAFQLMPEASSHCSPPTDNSRTSGTCSGKRVEGGLLVLTK